MKRTRAPQVELREVDLKRVLYELQVHQVELEMQNDELRKVQRELEESRDEYQELYDHAPVGYLTLDARGTITRANLTAAALLEVARESLLGRKLSSFMAEADADRFHFYRRELFSSARGLGCELRLRTEGGRVFRVRLDSVVVSASRGEPRRCRTVLRDLTELSEAQDKLRDSESRFRQIAEHIEDVFYVRERTGEVSYVSPAYERVWGRPAAELHGDSSIWLGTVHPDDRERVARGGEGVFAGRAMNEEYRICRPDGAICRVRGREFPVEDERGDVVRAIGVVQDVTAARQLEEEFCQAQKMEAIGTLASGIAHDFRNLLHTIIGYTSLAQDAANDSPSAGLYMRKVVEAAHRGASLINQLMSFSHKHPINLQPLRIDAAIEGLTVVLARLLGERITLQVAAGAPGSTIMADPVQLEQIILNLTINARDAMPEGGTITIRTEEVVLDPHQAQGRNLSRSGPYVRVVVQDTGKGMSEDVRRHIFEPFFTTKGVGKGTGLGLSTVFTTVRNLGGHIEVMSQPGAGTTFALHLPRCDQGDAANELAGEHVQAATLGQVVPPGSLPESGGRAVSGGASPASVCEGRATILLVEESDGARLALRDLLQDAGYSVLAVARPSEALRVAAVQGQSIDLVLTAVRLPEMAGDELARLLRERRPGAQVIFMSALPGPSAAADGLFIAKPIEIDDLVGLVGRALGDTPRRSGRK